MPTTPNLLIDHIVQSQSQKEVTANTAFDRLEKAITEEFGLAFGGGAGDQTLSDADMRNAIIRLTGTLTGNRNLIVPARDKVYIIHNATTGAFTATVKTLAGTGIVVKSGMKAIVYCDGTNVLDLSGSIQNTGIILAQSGVQIVAPADTNLNTLLTVTIPAGLIGINGFVEIYTLWGLTNNANNKDLYIRLDGNNITNINVPNASNFNDYRRFHNRNAANSQIAGPNQVTPLTSGTAAVVTLTVDTALAKNLTWLCQKATAGDTIAIESYLVRIYPKHAI